MTLNERGIPDVDFSIVDSKVIGPFNVAGTYHLLDTIHGGMNLVVNVADVEVHMSGTKFKQAAVVIHRGMSIALTSDDDVQCVISNGYWKNVGEEAVPLKEHGLPLPKVGYIVIGYDNPSSQIIGPFNTVGAYHLYDTIHANKNLTITVQK